MPDTPTSRPRSVELYEYFMGLVKGDTLHAVSNLLTLARNVHNDKAYLDDVIEAAMAAVREARSLVPIPARTARQFVRPEDR